MVVENAFGILVSKFRVLQITMDQRQNVVRGIVFTCVVLHYINNDVAALQNEQVIVQEFFK